MRKTLLILCLALACCALLLHSQQADPFIVKPYLQLGDRPKAASTEGLSLLWHAAADDAAWQVQLADSSGHWRDTAAPASDEVKLPGADPHRVYRAELTGLKPGAGFSYRVLRNGQAVFTSMGRARKAANQPFSFVLFGDAAAGTPGQRAIAYEAYLQHPDFLFIAGDIVYTRGRIAEYREKFFPVYNSDTASPETGAPLLRSVLFLAAPGNHDVANRDLQANPDGLAYFYYWAQPLDGFTAPDTLQGSPEAMDAFRNAAGANFPRMTNFSFDYGNSHWLSIDSNPYVDITGPKVTRWVEQDLKAAKDARWKFVAFHHPGFNSSRTHFEEQQMRLMSAIFERNKVDIVFTGHVHNYQRTFPLHFKAGERRERAVDGEWKLDRKFDGVSRTKPDGVIYLVSGGGGAKLYNPEQQSDPASLQEFTCKYVADTHSLTYASVSEGSVRIRQIAEDGREVDAFTVTK